MITLPTKKESIDSLFQYMVLRFAGDRFPDLNLTYQFVFTDIDDGYPIHIIFSRGTAEHHEGMSGNPSITIRTPSELWLDIAGRHRNPLRALLTKKLAVTGKLAHLSMLPRLLTREIDPPRSHQFPDR